MLKQLVRGAFRMAGYEITSVRGLYVGEGLRTIHEARFLEDPRFLNAWKGANRATGCAELRSSWRIHIGLWAASAAARLDGDFIECGVNGGYLSSAIVRYLDWNELGKRFYLVDTFAGPVLSQYSQEEIAAGRLRVAERAIASGGYVTDLEAIRGNYEGWKGIVLTQGIVPDVLPSIGVERVAFLHLDMNCAMPECEALRYFWERMSPGGMVLLDDYSFQGCEVQGRELDAVARSLGTTILSLPTGQGLMVR